MKRIPLTQGKYALVDDEDYERLNQYKWQVRKHRHTFYAQRSTSNNGRRKTIQMHHEIIGHPPENLETDHKDGKGLNNQRNNLRHVTGRQNMQNQKNRKNKTSQYPGVGWHKLRQKWRARIVVSGVEKHLGLFINELEAFEIYKQAINDIGEEVVGGIG